MTDDLKRELQKVFDVLVVVDHHFSHEAEMNAALHMATTIRPAPLAAAVSTAMENLSKLIGGEP